MKSLILIKTGLIALPYVLYISCSSRGVNASLGAAHNENPSTHLGLEIQSQVPTLDNCYTFGRFSSDDEYLQFRAEQKYVNKLENNISQNIDVNKNKSKLQQFSEDLQLQCNKRVSARMDFLRDFYTDIYSLNGNAIYDKYKKHCTRELLKRLKNTYNLAHETDKGGYSWVVFTDNKFHKAGDFSFSHLNGQWENLDKDFADFMYGEDKTWLNEHPYPYYNKEDKWYKVRMGDNNVMVKVEGLGKRIAITGVINPAMNVWINTWYDR